jgi:hypothetical protein
VKHAAAQSMNVLDVAQEIKTVHYIVIALSDENLFSHCNMEILKPAKLTSHVTVHVKYV